MPIFLKIEVRRAPIPLCRSCSFEEADKKQDHGLACFGCIVLTNQSAASATCTPPRAQQAPRQQGSESTLRNSRSLQPYLSAPPGLPHSLRYGMRWDTSDKRFFAVYVLRACLACLHSLVLDLISVGAVCTLLDSFVWMDWIPSCTCECYSLVNVG